MARKKSTTTKKATGKRLAPTEQVRDRKTQATGFGSKHGHFTPLTSLSISDIRDIIITSIWMETCINTIVDEVVSFDFVTEPKNKKIDAFLELPSEKEPLFLIRKKYLKDMLRYGNGGAAIAYKGKEPVSLSVVPGYAIKVTDAEPPTYKLESITSRGENIKDKSGKKDLELSLKELMHFQIDADSDATKARSNIERVYQAVLADKQIAKNLATYTERGLYKPAFMSIQQISKTNMKEFLEFLNEEIANYAKMLGINRKAELQEVPHWTPEEIIKMQKWIGLQVANVYKVPPFMLNLVEDTGSLNAREQRARFLANVISPILKLESWMYTLILARKGFRNLKTKITIPLIGTKLTWDKVRIARQLLGNSDEPLFTVDEIRKDIFGKDPIKKKNSE